MSCVFDFQLVLLAAFFAIRIGSVEMVPVPEVVSRAAARVSKEKNRRSTGDIYESARRRAGAPISVSLAFIGLPSLTPQAST